MKYVIAILLAIGCSVVASIVAKMFGIEASGSIGGGVGAAASVVYIMYIEKKEKGKG